MRQIYTVIFCLCAFVPEKQYLLLLYLTLQMKNQLLMELLRFLTLTLNFKHNFQVFQILFESLLRALFNLVLQSRLGEGRVNGPHKNESIDM